MIANGRKNLKAVDKVFSVLVICFFLAVLFISLLNSRTTPINDSDLIFARPQIPVESNAFWTLPDTTNKIYWPDKLSDKLDDLSNNTNWDDSLAAEVLAKNQACLKSFDEAMRQPALLVPEPKSFEDEYPYLGVWRNLARLESIQVISLHRAKKDKEALDRAFETISFGHHIENAGGPIITCLVGSNIKSVGLRDIRQMLVDTTLSETNLEQSIRDLNHFGANLDGFTNALKVEYETQRNLIGDFTKGTPPGTTNNDFERVMTSLGIKLFLNPRKTKMVFAQGDRFLFGHFSKPYAQIPWSNLPSQETNGSAFGRLTSGNVLGDILIDMLKPSLQEFAKKKSTEDVNVTATRLLLALKIYKTQRGKLPDSLSQLVPDFFPRVPLDDFDGQPFRYLPNKNIIYSVGPCLKDLGGKERKNYSDDYNLPFNIEF